MPSSVPPSEVVARLREVPFLAPLPSELLDQLRREGTLRSHSRGELLFARGEPARGLYVVIRGSVRVYQVGDTGREQVLTTEAPGSPVAELPLFDGGAYPAHAEAAEESVLFLLSPERFDALLAAHPQIARAVIRMLATRLRRLVQMTEALGLKEVRQRVAGLLLQLAAERGSEFTLPASNEQVAAQLGTVREVVSRALHGFAHD
ncbi:MAG TPA: Crp/Fnr family transcriptional regulator, partial [Armatimonadota bacterium]|nr:Crp/Fnr family transcriptional regulator [Armatimonadota bacterium]